ncbi:MAG: HD domain-containing protein [Deltaproteobacteria bacterium]|nr:HD domain-containing protein [Deltaproteobacteria bacterium]
MLTTDPILALARALERPDIAPIVAALGADAELHLVGGSIRDAFLGRETHDLDFATKLLPDEVVQRLERASIRVIPTGLAHQTVTALVEVGSEPVEITTFRAPGISTEKRVVAGNSIEQDLALRDFTMNALAWSVQRGAIVDPLGGVADIQARRIRAAGDAEQRFREDPLRIIRMIRFAAELGFLIDEETKQAAGQLATLLSGVSVERIREEFSKIIVSPRPADGLQSLLDLGILEIFLPELATCAGFEQNRFHKADVFVHTLEVVERTRPDLVLRLSALFHDIGKPPTMTVDAVTGDRHFFRHEVIGADMTRDALERLRYSNDVNDQVTSLVRLHMRPIEAGPPGLRRLLRDTGDLFELWKELKVADTKACKIDSDEVDERMKQFEEAIAKVQAGPSVSPLSSLALRGKDLLALGFEAGPHIGEILRALHERVLDDPELNTFEVLQQQLPAICQLLNVPLPTSAMRTSE